MPDQMPRSIQQISADTSRDTAAILNVLARQQEHNPWSEAAKIVKQYTDAAESERLANAIDLFNRRREAGADVNTALEGINSRIAGSKAFQQRMDEIRTSLINKNNDRRADQTQARLDRADDRAERVFQEELRKTRNLEAAKKLGLDYWLFENRVGKDAAFAWLTPEMEAKIRNNPEAAVEYEKLRAAGVDFSMPTPIDEKSGSALEFTPISSETLNRVSKDTVRATQELGKYGLSIPTDPSATLERLSTEKALEKISAGQKDPDDLTDTRENFYDAVNYIRAAVQQATDGKVTPSDALIASALLGNTRSSVFGLGQPEYNRDAALKEVLAKAPFENNAVIDAETIHKNQKIVDDALANKTLQTLELNLDKAKQRYIRAVQEGSMTPQQAKLAYARQVSNANVIKSTIENAMNDLLAASSRYK